MKDSSPTSQTDDTTGTDLEKRGMSPQEVAAVRRDLDLAFESYDRKAWGTMIGYFVCVIGSAVFSAVAALLLQLGSTQNSPRARDIASILAALAAILITLNTLVAFNEKWRADRLAASEINSLLNRLKGGDLASKKFYYKKMDEIERKRQIIVLGQSPAAASNDNK